MKNVVEAPDKSATDSNRNIIQAIYSISIPTAWITAVPSWHTLRMSLTWECAGISKITRLPWDMLHKKH